MWLDPEMGTYAARKRVQLLIKFGLFIKRERSLIVRTNKAKKSSTVRTCKYRKQNEVYSSNKQKRQVSPRTHFELGNLSRHREHLDSLTSEVKDQHHKIRDASKFGDFKLDPVTVVRVQGVKLP